MHHTVISRHYWPVIEVDIPKCLTKQSVKSKRYFKRFHEKYSSVDPFPLIPYHLYRWTWIWFIRILFGFRCLRLAQTGFRVDWPKAAQFKGEDSVQPNRDEAICATECSMLAYKRIPTQMSNLSFNILQVAEPFETSCDGLDEGKGKYWWMCDSLTSPTSCGVLVCKVRLCRLVGI